MDSEQLAAVKLLLVHGRELVASGWISGAGYAQGLDREEHEDFSRAWSRYYRPDVSRIPDDPVSAAIQVLAEAATGEEVPEGIPPIVMLSNWNEEPGRTQAQVVSAYDKAIAGLEALHA